MRKLIAVVSIIMVSAAFLVGCQQFVPHLPGVTQNPASTEARQALNLSLNAFSTKLANKWAGVDEDTAWFCIEPDVPNGFNWDEPTGVADNDTNESFPMVIKATILPASESNSAAVKSIAVSDGTGLVTCQAAFENEHADDYLPI